MIELRIEAGVLDLFPDTSITIEEHSPAYLGENVDVLEGEFSYPFTLPLSPNNRRLLGYPDRIDGGTPLPQKIPAQLYLLGNLHLDGQLYLEEPSRNQVKVYIASNVLLSIKDKEISSLVDRVYDLGTDNASVLSHMLTVSQSALDYDYTFFPVYNKTLTDDETAGEEYDETRLQNNWDPSTSTFTEDGPITLFPRLEVVLEDIMAATGYSFQNNFQTNDELRNLCLVNNRNLKDEEGDIAIEAVLSNHLADDKAGAFVRNLCRVFCLAPFLDFRRRSITLQPLGELLRRDTQIDWTAYLQREYSYLQGKTALNRLAYPAGAYNESPLSIWKADQAQSDVVVEDVNDIPADVGFYYEYSRGGLWRYFIGTSGSGDRAVVVQKARHFGAIDNDTGNEQNLPEIFPVFAGIARVPGTGQTESWQLPMWDFSPAAEGDTVDMRLAFHYGNGSTSESQPYPFGSWNNYDQNRDQYPGSNYSLGWEGPFGLYEKWWKNWDTMLQTGKMVTRNFLLPPAHLNRFSFDKKVRVDNKDYFVRSMRYQVSLHSISPVQVKMMSVS